MEDNQSLTEARKLLGQSRRPVIFTGAGVSADSGIPTFRGSGDRSFWGQYDPQQLATLQGFRADPKLVYGWYSWRRTQLREIQPNAAHQAIAQLQRMRPAPVITQNIDGLHESIAPEGATVLRLHGTLAADRCGTCFYREELDISAELPPFRRCPLCGDWMRPDVVWFGEQLDEELFAKAEEACAKCDTMLVVGTSGEVWPAAGLVSAAAEHAQVIVVNLDPGSLDEYASISLRGRAAEILPLIIP